MDDWVRVARRVPVLRVVHLERSHEGDQVKFAGTPKPTETTRYLGKDGLYYNGFLGSPEAAELAFGEAFRNIANDLKEELMDDRHQEFKIQGPPESVGFWEVTPDCRVYSGHAPTAWKRFWVLFFFDVTWVDAEKQK